MTKQAEASTELLAAREGGVLTLTLNRPEVLNALTPALLKELHKKLREASKDPEVRCVVLTGAGRGFCAGADLSNLKRADGRPVPFGDDLRDLFNPVVLLLRTLEKPTVAAVHGAAAGAGAGLALACDLKVLSEDSKIHLAFIKLALSPDSGMSWFLPRGLGLSKALEKAWTGEPISAQEAFAAGLANRLVPPGKALDEARTLAARLAALPPRAVALTKRAMNRGLAAGLESQLDYEAHLQQILGSTRDHREGLAAFLEKRQPQFKGE